jgi:cell fate (sporulation/competence/biofilm development) regulator YlbF (YheA/YmcA/DUF963 family)
MKRVIISAVIVGGLVLLVSGLAASVEEPNKGAAVSETPMPVLKPRARAATVTMVDFYMRDGNSVSGRLVSDDPTQLVVEQPNESAIVTKSYSKKEVDTRTVRTRPMQEWQYYVKMAEYFTSKTWDFIDDPDDFIEAIRCYEMAKQLLEGSPDTERIAEIDKALKKVRADKEVWTKEVESRANLKKMEYQAEAENRLKKLEANIAAGSVKLAESIRNQDKTIEDLKSADKNLDKAIADLNKSIVKQIENLQRQINDNLVLTDLCCHK